MTQNKESGKTPEPLLSVVVPVLNEAENIRSLVYDLNAALTGVYHELVFVDDGSDDDTLPTLRQLMADFSAVRCLHHQQRCGQSAAIRTGVQHAKGLIIATLDGDGQNPPCDIPKLLALLHSSSRSVKLIQGQRQKRQDTLWKRLGSRLANKIRQAILNDGVRDSGCGLKVFYKDAYLSLAYFDHLHRFMPAMMQREGYDVITCEVSHAERHAGQSKYGNLGRALVGIVDLAGMVWLKRRRNLSAVQEIPAYQAELERAG